MSLWIFALACAPEDPVAPAPQHECAEVSWETEPPGSGDPLLVWTKPGSSTSDRRVMTQAELVVYADGFAIYRQGRGNEFAAVQLGSADLATLLDAAGQLCGSDTLPSKSFLSVHGSAGWRRIFLDEAGDLFAGTRAGPAGVIADTLENAHPQAWQPSEVEVVLAPVSKEAAVDIAWPESTSPPASCAIRSVTLPATDARDLIAARKASTDPLAVALDSERCAVAVLFPLPRSEAIGAVIRAANRAAAAAATLP